MGAYIGGVQFPFAMRFEGLFCDGPQECAHVTILHDDHHNSLAALHSSTALGSARPGLSSAQRLTTSPSRCNTHAVTCAQWPSSIHWELTCDWIHSLAVKIAAYRP